MNYELLPRSARERRNVLGIEPVFPDGAGTVVPDDPGDDLPLGGRHEIRVFCVKYAHGGEGTGIDTEKRNRS